MNKEESVRKKRWKEGRKRGRNKGNKERKAAKGRNVGT